METGKRCGPKRRSGPSWLNTTASLLSCPPAPASPPTTGRLIPSSPRRSAWPRGKWRRTGGRRKRRIRARNRNRNRNGNRNRRWRDLTANFDVVLAPLLLMHCHTLYCLKMKFPVLLVVLWACFYRWLERRLNSSGALFRVVSGFLLFTLILRLVVVSSFIFSFSSRWAGLVRMRAAVVGILLLQTVSQSFLILTYAIFHKTQHTKAYHWLATCRGCYHRIRHFFITMGKRRQPSKFLECSNEYELRNSPNYMRILHLSHLIQLVHFSWTAICFEDRKASFLCSNSILRSLLLNFGLVFTRRLPGKGTVNIILRYGRWRENVWRTEKRCLNKWHKWTNCQKQERHGIITREDSFLFLASCLGSNQFAFAVVLHVHAVPGSGRPIILIGQMLRYVYFSFVQCCIQTHAGATITLQTTTTFVTKRIQWNIAFFELVKQTLQQAVRCGHIISSLKLVTEQSIVNSQE